MVGQRRGWVAREDGLEVKVEVDHIAGEGHRGQQLAGDGVRERLVPLLVRCRVELVGFDPVASVSVPLADGPVPPCAPSGHPYCPRHQKCPLEGALVWEVNGCVGGRPEVLLLVLLVVVPVGVHLPVAG